MFSHQYEVKPFDPTDYTCECGLSTGCSDCLETYQQEIEADFNYCADFDPTDTPCECEGEMGCEYCNPDV